MRRFIEMGAVVIARVRWIDGQSDGAAQHFVGACGTKAFPAEERFSRCHVKACHRYARRPFSRCVPAAVWVRPAQAVCDQ